MLNMILPLMVSSFSEFDYWSCHNQEGFMVNHGNESAKVLISSWRAQDTDK